LNSFENFSDLGIWG